MADGHRPAEKPLLDQLMDEVAQRDGKRGGVGHDVGQPGGWSAFGERRGDDADLAVKRAADDGDSSEVGGDLADVFLLGPGVRLERRITEFHDVPVTGHGQVRVGEIPVHDVPAARAESELDRRRVADDLIADRNRSRQLGKIVRALRFVFGGEVHEHALQPGPFADDLGHHAGAERRHELPHRGDRGTVGARR